MQDDVTRQHVDMIFDTVVGNITLHDLLFCIFTALHAMQTRSGDENSVRISVLLSNAWFVTKWKKDLSRFFIPYERSFSLFFWEEEWLVRATPSTWHFWSTGPCWSEITYFQPILARSASAVTPSEKSLINTNRKSTTSSPMSLRWSSYVVTKPPNGRFPSKIALRLQKVCYKVFFVWKLLAAML